MYVIIPFLVIIGVSLAFASAVKKMRTANARTNRPRPSADPIARPAKPQSEDRFDGAVSAFQTGAFESDTDFASGFGSEPDSSVTYEEGIDPCHDDMEHMPREEESAGAGMNRETAGELVRAFVMSEVLTRKRRR